MPDTSSRTFVRVHKWKNIIHWMNYISIFKALRMGNSGKKIGRWLYHCNISCDIYSEARVASSSYMIVCSKAIILSGKCILLFYAFQFSNFQYNTRFNYIGFVWYWHSLRLFKQTFLWFSMTISNKIQSQTTWHNRTINFVSIKKQPDDVTNFTTFYECGSGAAEREV